MELLTKEELNSVERIDKIKSQKAKALFRHEKYYHAYAIPQDWHVPNMIVLHYNDYVMHLKSIEEHMSYPLFLRSCPENARHGVLESFKCNNYDEFFECFTSLSTKMSEIEPNGCMIVMPYIKSMCSAVVAPSAVIEEGYQKEEDEYNEWIPHKWFTGYAIFGPDHDGVTAGHGKQLGFPLRNNKSDNSILNTMNIDEKVHELEFIFKERHEGTYEDNSMGSVLGDRFDWLRHNMTQIRHAPVHIPMVPPPEGVDTKGMVPQGRVEVKEVWEATGLEEVAWLEENITKDKCPEGFVVQEINGSLLAHVCAHCRDHDIPYVIGKVNVGEIWTEAAMGWVVLDPDKIWEPKPYNPLAYKDDFLKGVELGNKYWRKQQGWFSTFFHQWVACPHSKPQDVALLAGVFTAWLTKAVLGLGLGEMRHGTSRKNNATLPLYASISACIGEDVWSKLGPNSSLSSKRGDYYVAMSKIKLDWGDTALMFDYLAMNYNKGWSKGYGGIAWGESMLRGAKLARALDAFVTESTDDNLRKLIGTVNSCENAEHNNGFLFNKWLSKTAFDVGTGGFSPRRNLEEMAQTYDMARQFVDETYIPLGISAEKPTNDWKEILNYVMKKTPSYWRKSPLGMNKNAPQVLRDTVAELPTNFRHPSRGAFNEPSDKKFIRCGLKICVTCDMHTKVIKSVPEPITSQYHGLEDALITTAPTDVWLAGTKKHSISDEIKMKTSQIVTGEISITPKSFVDITQGLHDDDPEYVYYHTIFIKWIAKNDGKFSISFWEEVKDIVSGTIKESE